MAKKKGKSGSTDKKEVIMVITKSAWKKLGQIALEKETSRSALIRDAIHQYIKKLEKSGEA